MNVPRADHACTVIKDKEGTIVKILVAGGVEDLHAPSGLESTEIYDVENKSWEMGPSLFYPTLGSSLVHADKSSPSYVYLVGGCQYYKNGKRRGDCSEVYGLSKHTNDWIRVGDLKQSTINPVALLTPPNF